MGDVMDRRKYVSYKTATDFRKRFIDRFIELDIDLHIIVGNHDTYYKNTSEVNSMEELVGQDKFKIYTFPDVVNFDDTPILFIPWINSSNYDSSMQALSKSKADLLMGHLEINGFTATQGHIMEHGMEGSIFEKFDKVYSGHYHTRSNNGKIYYLGNPYEMFWNDVEDTRGYHIFDTETLEHIPINNPYRLFYKIFYEDNDYQTFDTRPYENKIVKLIVRKKTNTKKFEKFVDKLYNSNVAELKIVENFEFQESEEFEAFESEDTLSILNRYIEEAEVNLDKSRVQKVIQEVYQEACELI